MKTCGVLGVFEMARSIRGLAATSANGNPFSRSIDFARAQCPHPGLVNSRTSDSGNEYRFESGTKLPLALDHVDSAAQSRSTRMR